MASTALMLWRDRKFGTIKESTQICRPLYTRTNYTSVQATAITGFTPLIRKQAMKSGQSECRILCGGARARMKTSSSLDSDAAIFRTVIRSPLVRSSHLMWRLAIPYGSMQQKDAVLTAIAVQNGYVTFGSRDGSVYCLRATDGKRNWQTGLGAPVVSSPACNTQYCLCRNEKRLCLCTLY